MRPSQRATCVPGGTSTTSGVAVRAVLQSAQPVPAAVRPVVAATPERLQVAQRVVAAQRSRRRRGRRRRRRARPSGHGPHAGRTATRRRPARLEPRYARDRPACCGVTIGTMDRVMVITGASTGIGAATARQAAEAGYRVVLAARTRRQARVAGRANSATGRARSAATSASTRTSRRSSRRRSTPSAGSTSCSPTPASASRAASTAGDPEDAKQMILTNVFGVWATIRATAQALRETKGHLLITSSIAGRRALKGSLYSSTKFAVTGMGEAARLDFNGTGVRVTLIEPGMVETEGFSHDLDETLPRRRHRPRRHVRRRAAAARRRQRDPRAADRAGHLANHPFGRWQAAGAPVRSAGARGHAGPCLRGRPCGRPGR